MGVRNHDAIVLLIQAASPDEVALVQWSEEVGLTLVDRDLHSVKLRTPTGDVLSYTILQSFPFTSESKRMGIILQDDATGERLFYLKGADTVMSSIVQVMQSYLINEEQLVNVNIFYYYIVVQ